MCELLQAFDRTGRQFAGFIRISLFFVAPVASVAEVGAWVDGPFGAVVLVWATVTGTRALRWARRRCASALAAGRETLLIEERIGLALDRHEEALNRQGG
jgi:hypothetical protein